MADIKINPDFKDRRISHNKTSKTVGEHTPAELLQLGIIARSSNNPRLMECFNELPTMDELVSAQTAAELKLVKDNTLTATKAVTTKQ